MRVDDQLNACAVLLESVARRKEPLGPKTTYRVGGSAELFVEVDCAATLERVVRAVVDTGVEVLVIGNGSNLLVAERGFSGLAIHLGGDYEGLEFDAKAGAVDAGAAVAYPMLARKCASAGLSGLEWTVGIPGTVGGAVTMNAGGHGSDTASGLLAYHVVDLRSGEESNPSVDALGATYRHTNLAPYHVVLGARFRATPEANMTRSRAQIDEIVRWRREHQPGGRNCGSVFINPANDSAGRLIEAAGLKGHRIGTAAVSMKHANFIQTDAGGCADDVRELILFVRRRVYEDAGVELDTELRMIGFDA